MSEIRQKLRPAHAGYEYQDALTAYCLLRLLSEPYVISVTVDRKEHDSDLFDDIAIESEQCLTRIQVKSAIDGTRRLATEDLRTQKRDLRLDGLLRSFHSDNNLLKKDVEYVIATNWLRPAINEQSCFNETLARTTYWFDLPCNSVNIDLGRIWNADAEPSWTCLRNIDPISRDEAAQFCQKLTILTELPLSSSEVRTPGPMEQHIGRLLTNRIGIGRYPNEHRNMTDVAAKVIALAREMRTHSASATKEDVERFIELRTDYGRIIQKFPVIQQNNCPRTSVVSNLRRIIEEGKHIALVGEPGIGKSWILTELMNELRNDGIPVAHHYCYLEPGDEFAEWRILSNVMFGNLRWDLVEHLPALKYSPRSVYSAGIEELEDALKDAARNFEKIVLIIDGLDHIARVQATAQRITPSDTDIIDQLAGLTLPPQVVLVIGSQPGSHLGALQAAYSPALEIRQVPNWCEDELISLFTKLGVREACHDAAIVDPEDALKQLATRSDGNPLYGTYLASSLITGLPTGSIQDIRNWIAELPPIAGEIASYYAVNAQPSEG